jgi:hypothetical protein
MTSAAARTGRANEDFTGAVPAAAVLIDGAGGFSGAESICRHGVAWYASYLGGSLLSLLSHVRDRSLSALLAEAIEQVTDEHRDTLRRRRPDQSVGDRGHPALVRWPHRVPGAR